MKTIISHLAQASPQMDAAAFEKAYVAQHPQGASLTADNIRQSFAAFNKYVRKNQRNHAKQHAQK